MGRMRKTMLTAVAAKIFQEARKPENQRKVRRFIETQRAKRGRAGGASRPTV
jgi:hypothetical protein